MSRRITEHFKEREMRCKCGCNKLKYDCKLIAKLEILRDRLKVPIIITSGYRCVEHNKRVGGTAKSMHLQGKAVDIKTNGSFTALVNECSKLFKNGGFKAYNGYVHVDVGAKRRW